LRHSDRRGSLWSAVASRFCFWCAARSRTRPGRRTRPTTPPRSSRRRPGPGRAAGLAAKTTDRMAKAAGRSGPRRLTPSQPETEYSGDSALSFSAPSALLTVKSFACGEAFSTQRVQRTQRQIDRTLYLLCVLCVLCDEIFFFFGLRPAASLRHLRETISVSSGSCVGTLSPWGSAPGPGV